MVSLLGLRSAMPHAAMVTAPPFASCSFCQAPNFATCGSADAAGAPMITAAATAMDAAAAMMPVPIFMTRSYSLEGDLPVRAPAGGDRGGQPGCSVRGGVGD